MTALSTFHWRRTIGIMLVAAGTSIGNAAMAFAQGTAPPLATNSAPISFDQIGSAVARKYDGDGISVSATPGGARLQSAFQKLSGEATRDGLWLTSTDDDGGRLRLVAAAIRRGDARMALALSGRVGIAGSRVSFTRLGLVEEYQTSVEGVRQDFILAERPGGTGDVHLDLTLTVARAEIAADGARFTLDGSARVLAYNRLRVTDVTGRELTASLAVIAPDRLAVRVNDAEARYPVRIDPTFSDADWISMNPGLRGANDAVNAIDVDTHGNIYVGGSFTFIGTVAANFIAKWDGSAWSPLGTGTNSPVFALVVGSQDKVYAGGRFSTAGGAVVNRIAAWDGHNWSPLGTGIQDPYNEDPAVFALAATGTELYAGGSFVSAGGVTAFVIARWNGSGWSALGLGISGTVYALALRNSELFAGGEFSHAGPGPAYGVARWDGSAWSALGISFAGPGGVNGPVYALAVTPSVVYAAGAFTGAFGPGGLIPANHVARWNGGTSWTALGTGLSDTIRALAVSGNILYAAGDFVTSLGKSGAANRIAKWDGSAWSLLGSGFGGSVNALLVNGTDVYAGGGFTTAGGQPALRIAAWSGSTWSQVGPAMASTDNAISAVAVNDRGPGHYTLYIAGSFAMAGGVPANGIAAWDGSTWRALGTGMNGLVRAIVVRPNFVYAGGDFTTAGGVTVNHIARWNGNSW